VKVSAGEWHNHVLPDGVEVACVVTGPKGQAMVRRHIDGLMTP
jgi:hypothetical protein